MGFLEGNFIALGEYETNFLRNGGSIEQTVDGSITPVLFCYTVPFGFSFYVDRLHVVIIADKKMDGGDFGGIANGLDEGINIFLTDPTGTQIKNLLDGETIKRNADWGQYSGGSMETLWETGFVIDWDFSSSIGRPIRLSNRLSFCMLIRDDLTSLIRLRSTVQGAKVDAAQEAELGVIT